MLFAASIETLFIFLLIAGGSALVNWLKRKGENTDILTDDELSRPTRSEAPPFRDSQTPARTPAKPATNWEEELRRMLEGTVPTTRTPPPIVVQERKPPVSRPSEPVVPERTTRSLPKAFQEKYYKAHCNHCGEHIEFPASAMEEVTACPHCHQATVLRPFEDTTVEALAHKKVLTQFNASTRAYEQASQLSQRVAAHMHGVGHQAVGLTSTQTIKRMWPEVAETVALFRNAKTVRQAVVASLILGPPKALEN